MSQNLKNQLRLLSEFGKLSKDLPYYDKSQQTRYTYPNGYYPLGDAALLFGFLKKYKPKRIVEIGSGFSTAVMLDANERHFANAIEINVVDPYPERLSSLCRSGDLAGIRLMESPVQEAPMDLFERLSAQDILFIDSSHVSKFNSDLNFLVFNVLPSLKSGVLVHFHDIYWPFEYPAELYEQGIAWNEGYFVRAFLQFNTAFSILLFPQYLMTNAYHEVQKSFPLCLEGGAVSLWIQKA